jgi:tRNA A-37 threonylcarbamoyl transferase component Bud32
VTGPSTQLFGRTDPQAVLGALVADLVARGVVDAGVVDDARPLVAQGRLPSTALVAVGVDRDAVVRALAIVSGFAAAPPRAQWDASVRGGLGVADDRWQALLAVPIATVAGRPLVAFADVGQIAASATLALPPHEVCVALEDDVRAALAVAAVKPKAAGVAFLAPPSALAPGLASGGAFGAATTPALAVTRAAPLPAATPAPAASSPPAPAAPLPSFVAPTPTATPAGPSPFATPTPAGGAVRPVLAGTMVGQVPSTTSSSPSLSSSPPAPAPPSAAGSFSLEPPAGFDRTLLGPGALALSTPPPSATATPAPPWSQATPPTSATTMVQAPAPATSSVDVGSRCGRFVLERRLGEGGMATVFVGVPDDGGPRVAIKVVHDHLLRSAIGEDLRRRFAREVAAMRQLDHPAIVACVDAGQVQDTEYLATAFIGGGSLSDLLTRTGKLPAPLALAFFGDLLEGLAHAHGKGIIHRDLKPDNLLLDVDGRVKIADFGIARVTEGTALTATGTFVGTPAYMSPEQASASPIDVRSDLYSAGVILYELLSGRNPFADAQLMTTLANVLQGNWRPLGEVEVATPLLVDVVVSRLLATRPDDRLPSARAVLDALRPLLDEAQAWRELWRDVVMKVDGAMARALARGADEIVAVARHEQADGEARRLCAGFMAFRATSLSPDHAVARPMLRALGHGSTLRFGRSPNLYAMEGEAERAGDRRAAFLDVARAYLGEQNPNFAAAWARRAVVVAGVDDDALALLAEVYPAAEVQQVATLPERLGDAMPRSAKATLLARSKGSRPQDPPPRSSSSLSLGDMAGGVATGAPPPAITIVGTTPSVPSSSSSSTTTTASAGPPKALIAAVAVIVVLVLVIVGLLVRGAA